MRFFKFRDNTNNIPIRDVCFHKQPIHKNLSSILIKFVINTISKSSLTIKAANDSGALANIDCIAPPRARATAFMRL